MLAQYGILILLVVCPPILPPGESIGAKIIVPRMRSFLVGL